MSQTTLEAIRHESAAAEEAHGDLPSDVYRQFMVLAREVGELAMAMSDADRGRGTWVHAYSEAIQVASVAALIAEDVEQRKHRGREESKPPPKVPTNWSPLEPGWEGGTRRPRSFDPDDPPPKPAIVTTEDWVREHREHGIRFEAMTGKRECNCGETWDPSQPDGFDGGAA